MQEESQPAMTEGTALSTSIVVSGGDPFARIGIVSTLDQEHGFSVVGHVSPSADLERLIAERRPDLVVLCGESDLLSAYRALEAAAHTPRVLVVLPPRKRAAGKGSHLRVAGVKVTLTTMATLLPAARLLRSGYQIAAAHGDHEEPVDCTRRQANAWERFDRLTEREVQVMHLILRGWSNAEIADALMLSGATVKSHVHSLMNKLELRSRVDLITTAYTTGLVGPGVPKPNWHPSLAGNPA